MNLVELLLDPLQYGFMVRALAVAVVAAVVCAVLSCWLVLIGWSLMGDAVSHAVLPGVVLAYVVGAPFAIGALIFGLIAVALIGLIRNTSRVKEDAAIGIRSEEHTSELQSLMRNSYAVLCLKKKKTSNNP